MTMHYAFAKKSRNAKTGNIPVTTSGPETCPDACPLKASGACYAKHGPLGMYWQKIAKGLHAISFDALLANVRALPPGTLWRHNQAGDLPGVGDSIDVVSLMALVDANRGKKGFTYTHKPVDNNDTLEERTNRSAIDYANKNGFTINLSADSPREADSLKALNIGPVVTVLPRDAGSVTYTPQGNKIVVCPAQTRDDVSCKSCGLCAKATRDVIVGFLAHGVSAKKAEAIALA